MAARTQKNEFQHPFELTVDFLKKLEKNNRFEWFRENREFYEIAFLIPAQEFVQELGVRLKALAPDLNIIPKIDKAIFRLHRDIRFSKNKLPFKTHLGIFMWEGSFKKMESSGFYFQLDKTGIFLGTGTYMFEKKFLLRYREVVSNPAKAKELLKLLSGLQKKGYSIGGKTLKKAPRGIDPAAMNEALLYTALFAMLEVKPVPAEIFNDPEMYCFKHFKAMLPVHKWLMQNVYQTNFGK